MPSGAPGSAYGEHFFQGRWYAVPYDSSGSYVRLYDFRHRAYAPVLGRFLQVDPARSSLMVDASGNVYEFVAGRPTHAVDPSGLYPPIGVRTMRELLLRVDRECRAYCDSLRQINPNWRHASSPAWPRGRVPVPNSARDYWISYHRIPRYVSAPLEGRFELTWDVLGYFRRWDGGVFLGPGETKWYEQNFTADGYTAPPGRLAYTVAENRTNRELSFQMHRVVIFSAAARRGWAYIPPPPAPQRPGTWTYGPVLWEAVGHEWCVCRRQIESLCEVVDYMRDTLYTTQGPPSR